MGWLLALVEGLLIVYGLISALCSTLLPHSGDLSAGFRARGGGGEFVRLSLALKSWREVPRIVGYEVECLKIS